MWGKAKGIDLFVVIACTCQAFCGFFIYLGFCETNTNGLSDRKVANILNLEPSQKPWYCDSGP